jgi:hypothetical protein
MADIEKLDLSEFKGFEQKIGELCYMGDGGLARCTGPQRHYIYGLLDKAGLDLEYFGFDDIHEVTIIEAGNIIDELKFMTER